MLVPIITTTMQVRGESRQARFEEAAVPLADGPESDRLRVADLPGWSQAGRGDAAWVGSVTD